MLTLARAAVPRSQSRPSEPERLLVGAVAATGPIEASDARAAFETLIARD
jgi:hypothetical protein